MNKEWQFNGFMNCDKCKFYKFDCRVGESGCPYMGGWQDGQKKLIEYIGKEYQCRDKDDLAVGYVMISPEVFDTMIKELEIKNEI